MLSSPSTASALLCDEIRAEAQRACEDILRAAREQARKEAAKAEAEADRQRRDQIARADAEASRQRVLVLATVPLEIARRRATSLDAILLFIREEVRRRLEARADFDDRATVCRLAAEALNRMAGREFILRLAPEDHARWNVGLPQELLARLELEHRSSRLALVSDPAVSRGGLIVQDAAGRQVWDNRLLSRLDRLWPELRRQIAAGIGLDADAATEGQP